jgi:hypothetical protein
VVNQQRARLTQGELQRDDCGILVLLGTMGTLVAFSDYQTSNYAGFVIAGIRVLADGPAQRRGGSRVTIHP